MFSWEEWYNVNVWNSTFSVLSYCIFFLKIFIFYCKEKSDFFLKPNTCAYQNFLSRALLTHGAEPPCDCRAMCPLWWMLPVSLLPAFSSLLLGSVALGNNFLLVACLQTQHRSYSHSESSFFLTLDYSADCF